MSFAEKFENSIVRSTKEEVTENNKVLNKIKQFLSGTSPDKTAQNAYEYWEKTKNHIDEKIFEALNIAIQNPREINRNKIACLLEIVLKNVLLTEKNTDPEYKKLYKEVTNRSKVFINDEFEPVVRETGQSEFQNKKTDISGHTRLLGTKTKEINRESPVGKWIKAPEKQNIQYLINVFSETLREASQGTQDPSSSEEKN